MSFDEEVATTARHLMSALASDDEDTSHQGVEDLLRQRSDLRNAVVRAEQVLVEEHDADRRAVLQHNLA